MQESLDHIDVQIVAGPGFTEADEARIERDFRARLRQGGGSRHGVACCCNRPGEIGEISVCSQQGGGLFAQIRITGMQGKEQSMSGVEKQNHDSSEWDCSSHPQFYGYYEKQSLSPATLERFATVRDKVLKLIVHRSFPDAETS